MRPAERFTAALGAAMVIGGWVWSAGTTDAADQVGAVALAGGGVVAGGAAAVIGTSGRWRTVARARTVALAALREALPTHPPTTAPVRQVTVAGGTWTHLSTCLLVRGKRTRASRSGRPGPPCPVCGGGAGA